METAEQAPKGALFCKTGSKAS